MVCEKRTGSLFPGEHQHWHRQRRFGEARKIFGILIERMEVLESRTHPPGLRVYACVEFAIRFADRMPGVGGELVLRLR
jgi:hypothetical protein